MEEEISETQAGNIDAIEKEKSIELNGLIDQKKKKTTKKDYLEENFIKTPWP